MFITPPAVHVSFRTIISDYLYIVHAKILLLMMNHLLALGKFVYKSSPPMNEWYDAMRRISMVLYVFLPKGGKREFAEACKKYPIVLYISKPELIHSGPWYLDALSVI